MFTGTDIVGTPQTFARIVHVTFFRGPVPIRVVYCNTHTHRKTSGLYKVLCSFGTLIMFRGPPAMAVLPSCMEHGRLIEAAATTNSAGAALAGSHCVFTQLI
jgi:hypothetical protein